MEPARRDPRRRTVWCAAALVAGSWTAVAQAQTWVGATSNFNDNANWSPATVPTGTATFANTGTNAVTVAAGTAVGGFQFNTGAQAYSFTFAAGGVVPTTFNGTGVVNNSSNAPSFTVNAGLNLTFANSASAGNAAIQTSTGAVTIFTNSATAGSASILTSLNGTTEFQQGSSAGSAHLTGNNGGTMNFRNSSSAGQATVNFVGPNGGVLQFFNTSTAGNATITSNGFGHVKFFDTSTAGNATIVSNGGDVIFQNSSTAGNATITVNPGGNAEFFDTSQGGTARFINNGSVDFSFDGPAGGLTAGSIEGAGSFTIGGNQFTVGGNNLSTTMSGSLSDLGLGGSLVKQGTGTLALTGENTYQGGTTVSGGVLQGNTASLQGNILNNAVVTFDQATDGTYFGTMSGSGRLTKQSAGTLTLTGVNTYSGGTTINGGLINFSAANNLGTGSITLNGGGLQWATGNTTDISAQLAPLGASGGTIDTNGNDVTFATGLSGSGALIKAGAGTLTLAGAGTYTGGTMVLGGTLQGTTSSLQGDIINNAAVVFVGGGVYAGVMSGSGSIAKTGAGILSLTGNSTYSGGTTVSGGILNFAAVGNLGTGTITLNGGGLQWATGNTADISGRLAPLGAGGGTFDTNGNNVTLASTISGTGALAKQGQGTLTLAANNLHSGGTTVTGGLINFTSASNFGTGAVTLNGGGLQWAVGSTADISSRLVLGGAGGSLDTNGNNVTLASAITGIGGFTKQGAGLLNLTGASPYTGPTFVNAGTLAVNGSIASNVTVGAAGTLGGNGTIAGNVVMAGTLAPGNSIGTLTVSGNFSQTGGVYQVEANAQGQADRINATGTATIGGAATVQVLAQPGNYGPSTTYTILRATGGVSGTYSGVSSNFAFLTPSLSYDANDVFLTLTVPQNPFTPSSLVGMTPNQKAVAFALNQTFANATGDYATVINALLGLSTFQAPAALNAISGEQYADFGTMNVNNSAMFMNAIGQQLALARGTATSSGQRQALAQACDVTACDGASLLSVWASALGGLGNVTGDFNASTASYNFAGAAAGIDYRIDPRFLVGIGAGYTAGNLWVNNFLGKGTSDSVAVAAYGSFTWGGFYADALGGYAYFNNQLQRQILISGLQPRTASGSTGANQALGQVETGYSLGIFQPANATVTPFARLQGSSVTQNAFSEWGAQSLSLNVNQQTTNSLRSTFGLGLAGNIPIGDTRTIDLGLRVGWQHEFASTTRSITAALSGAPFATFTVYGATPQPDSAVVSLQANTKIADSALLYLRYDGDIGSGVDNHTLNLGVRFAW